MRIRLTESRSVRGTELAAGMLVGQLFGPGGNTTLEYLDRWAANTGRSEGATAEEAVPFPRAARRSFVLRLVAFSFCCGSAQLDGKSIVQS
jgi:hypothetical protein